MKQSFVSICPVSGASAAGDCALWVQELLHITSNNGSVSRVLELERWLYKKYLTLNDDLDKSPTYNLGKLKAVLFQVGNAKQILRALLEEINRARISGQRIAFEEFVCWYRKFFASDVVS